MKPRTLTGVINDSPEKFCIDNRDDIMYGS
jgi:hypothetical protein